MTEFLNSFFFCSEFLYCKYSVKKTKHRFKFSRWRNSEFEIQFSKIQSQKFKLKNSNLTECRSQAIHRGD